jgi:low temperature requirement protein LtrA
VCPAGSEKDLSFVLVRAIGLYLNYLVASGDPSQRAAVRTFIILSSGGFLAVLAGGFLGGVWQLVLWAGAIVLDVVAVLIAGSFEGWNVHPEHFSERHALFVIIALGETLIAAAGRVTGTPWTGPLLVVAILAVAVTCALWWTYFPRAKPALDHALEASQGLKNANLKGCV